MQTAPKRGVFNKSGAV